MTQELHALTDLEGEQPTPTLDERLDAVDLDLKRAMKRLDVLEEKRS